MRSRLPLCCYICIHNPNVSDPGPDGIHLRTQRFVFQNRSSSQSILDPKHLRSLFQIATVSFGGGNQGGGKEQICSFWKLTHTNPGKVENFSFETNFSFKCYVCLSAFKWGGRGGGEVSPLAKWVTPIRSLPVSSSSKRREPHPETDGR